MTTSDFRLYVFGTSRRSTLVFSPEMRNFDSIFHQLATDAKMLGNLGGITSPDHETAERRVRDQGGRANGISGFFIVVIVIPSRGVLRQVRLLADDRETVRCMTQEDVRNFFHQRGPISLLAVSGIEDHQSPPVRQGPRASAAGPFVGSVTQQMRARFRRQAFDAVEIDDQEPGKLRQRKRIEWLLALDARKVPQTERA